MKRYTVIRYEKLYFEVEAENREQAKEVEPLDPYNVEIIKETIKEVKESRGNKWKK